MIKKLRENISIFRLALVLLTLVTVLNSEIENHYHQKLYAAFLYEPIYLLFFIIYLVVVIFEVILYFKTKRIKSLIPSIIGCLLIIASFSVHYYHKDKMQQKTIFGLTDYIPLPCK